MEVAAPDNLPVVLMFGFAGLAVGALYYTFRKGGGRKYLTAMAILYVLTFAPEISEYILGPNGGLVGGLIYLSGIGIIGIVLRTAMGASFFGGIAIAALFDIIVSDSET
jgi:hypothetical protein